MDVRNLPLLQDQLRQSIEPEARKVLSQYFAGFKQQTLDAHLPRVTLSTVAEDKWLFGYLSALGDLITALNAEPVGDEPQKDSNDEMLL